MEILLIPLKNRIKKIIKMLLLTTLHCTKTIRAPIIMFSLTFKKGKSVERKSLCMNRTNKFFII